jgi:hypothetical protein
MVYNPNQEGIDDVRIETGNILPEDYPDTQIAKKLSSAYSVIHLAARRKLDNPFLLTDVEYQYSRELEVKIAARDALKAYGPEFDTKIKELDAEIKDSLQFLQDNLQSVGGTEGGGAGGGGFVYTPPAQTYPKNSNAPIYRSIKGGASSSTVHPWTLE